MVYLINSPFFALLVSSPPIVAFNVVLITGPAPVSNVILSSCTVCSTPVSIAVYITSYPCFAIWLYSRFSGTVISYSKYISSEMSN